MQHSAYASADKSLKVLPRSGSQLQEIHPEPGHQFCPIWLLTNPWQLHVAVLASAFEILSMTCTFMLIPFFFFTVKKSGSQCLYTWSRCAFLQLTAIHKKMKTMCKEIIPAKANTLNHIPHWNHTSYYRSEPTVHALKPVELQWDWLHRVAAQSIMQMNN